MLTIKYFDFPIQLCTDALRVDEWACILGGLAAWIPMIQGKSNRTLHRLPAEHTVLITLFRESTPRRASATPAHLPPFLALFPDAGPDVSLQHECD